MKKIISITILVLVGLLFTYTVLWEMTINPMIEIYKFHGIKGSIIYFLVELLALAAVCFVLWLVAWASDNLFKS